VKAVIFNSLAACVEHPAATRPGLLKKSEAQNEKASISYDHGRVLTLVMIHSIVRPGGVTSNTISGWRGRPFE